MSVIKEGLVRHLVVLIICLLIPLQAFADVIRLAAGLTVEPYIIEFNDSGFEADIVREAFALQGYKVQFVYQPLWRTKISFKRGTVDGVLTVQDHYPEIQGNFLSDEYITYHNFAVTLQSRNLKISTIAALNDKTIDAFQQAKFSLGMEFKLMAENNPAYKEMANQKNQIAQLFAKRNDVIVLDRLIFIYYRNGFKDFPAAFIQNISFEEPVVFHDLFEPSSYKIAFNVEKVRDAFNMGLKRLQESGRYRQIIESYVKE